jgi:PAS domain S-box-containing protein
MRKLTAELQQWLRTELFEQVPLNIAIIDKHFNIVEANRGFVEMFGEWKSRKCYAAFKGRKRRCKKCIAGLTFEDGECHVDDELGTDRKGRPTRYVLHTAPIRGKNGLVEFVIEMAQDVTRVRQIEQDAQILFDRAPNYIAVMDRQFRIVRANEKFRDTFGDRLGERCYKVYKKRNTKCDDCPADLTFKDGREHRGEQIGITAKGDRAHYVVTTAPLGRIGEKFAHVMEISTDVTEVRSLQNEIKSLYEFQDKLIQNSLDAVIATDERNKIVIFNPAAERLLGYQASRVAGQGRLSRFLPKEFLKIIQKKGDTCVLPETSICSKNKEDIPIRFSGVVLKDDDTVVGSAAFFQDLTQMKKLEAEKLESERMAAVGHTVAGLAHGVKNILTGIEGGLYVMNTGFQKSNTERILEGWQMLQRNFDKINVFTRDFLSFSKGEKPFVEQCQPTQIARDVCLLYRDAAERESIKLIDEIDDSIADACFDADGLHACLANLISNAIDACQTSDRKQGKVTLRVFERDATIFFEVVDNGSGMDYEVKKQVFTNFFTTKGTRGTGIGLLTTRKIVTQHHGNITFESEADKGSIFRLTFERSALPKADSSVRTRDRK